MGNVSGSIAPALLTGIERRGRNAAGPRGPVQYGSRANIWEAHLLDTERDVLGDHNLGRQPL